eukprot:TRINITY_DN18618_c0_g2_i2.p1 TRINITY_DN18618_c0_g2~~TRINITY_DN18618_c0_g2_i2.p1  ORF type:complete len:269 (+),score=60.77 TRINITY_DN18618_c0_g2_i2:155-961(+)
MAAFIMAQRLKQGKPDESDKAGKVEILLRHLSGQKLGSVWVSPLDSVRALKHKIMQTQGIAVREQRLVFGSQHLSNRQTIAEAQIFHQDVVTLVRVAPTPSAIVEPAEESGEAQSRQVLAAAEGQIALFLPAQDGDGNEVDGEEEGQEHYCQVLEELGNISYQPTEDEIDEYAEWLGMDPNVDLPFLHIAEFGLKAPLPEPWRACQAPDGEVFYFNFQTSESVWDHPIDEECRRRFQEAKKAARNPVAPKEPRTGAPAPRPMRAKRTS